MNEEIQRLKRIIADAKMIQRIEQLAIDIATSRLNKLEKEPLTDIQISEGMDFNKVLQNADKFKSSTTKAVFVESNNSKWIMGPVGKITLTTKKP